MFVVLLITVLVFIILVQLFKVFTPRIKFYLTGLDSGFKINEIRLLWSLGKHSNLQEPIALYWSIPSLDRCISSFLIKVRKSKSEKSSRTQDFLEKLYKYRTKIELEQKETKQITTTKSLKHNQTIRIVYPKHGVFKSRIVNIGRDIIITMPTNKKEMLFSCTDWVDQKISVYLNRHNDAGYVFDTFVKKIKQFNGASVLCLEHSDILTRIQKRQSIRVKTLIYGQLYIDKTNALNRKSVESLQGLKCLIEDISENGALIRTGGKAKPGFKLKLQYVIDEQEIVMYGVIKGVEYNKELNQSRMHFDCLEIDQNMKNLILTYVYNIIPDDEKAIFDAIKFATEDTEMVENENNEQLDEDKNGKNEQSDTMDSKKITENDSKELPVSQDDLKYDTSLYEPDFTHQKDIN